MNGESKMGATGPSVRMVPEGDDRERLVCPDCGHIHYENPTITVGAICTWEDKFLLCSRAIEPSLGLWTFPAGYLEENETTAEGAAREVWEEARARVQMDGLFGIYEIPRISQIYLIYRARMTASDCAPGPESADAALFFWDDIPWGELAFPSVSWALDELRRDPDGGVRVKVHGHDSRKSRPPA